MFVCVMMNKLGLIHSIESVIEHDLPVLNCVRCSTFWTTLVLNMVFTHDIVLSLAGSFALSYIALWLELLIGWLDTLYMKCYEKIYKHPDADKTTVDPDSFDTE